KQLHELPKKTTLVVLPEMWATGFTMKPAAVAETMKGPSVQWMKEMAKAHHTAICGSLAIKEGEHFYNRFIFVHPNLQVDTYDKVHPYTPSGESKLYRAGEGFALIEYAGFRIRPLVCYDLRFPVFVRNTDNYDLLICVANWPAARIQAWNALLRARAIENMAYSVGVNRMGKDAYRLTYPGASAAYTALGDEVIFMNEKESTAHFTIDLDTLHKTREKLPFLDDRDDFILK
ncbi:MAG: nitrilase family protein, partial [Flavobacteriaceae bacterium]|nr:nitrilase family protein [Flavobacteriaceae bacterium]